jgi:hypothetical protein
MAVGGRRCGCKGGTSDGLQRHVAGAHALGGHVEAHEGRGMRNTSDTMTMIGVESGHHDVSKSRQTAAS